MIRAGKKKTLFWGEERRQPFPSPESTDSTQGSSLQTFYGPRLIFRFRFCTVLPARDDSGSCFAIASPQGAGGGLRGAALVTGEKYVSQQLQEIVWRAFLSAPHIFSSYLEGIPKESCYHLLSFLPLNL